MRKSIVLVFLLFFIHSQLQAKNSTYQNHDQFLQMKINFMLDSGYIVYISFPYGGSLLIDTGNKTHMLKSVKNLKKIIFKGDKIYEFLSFLGWKPRIDWLILSNCSPDRIGGAKTILRNFRVKNILTTFPVKNISLKDTLIVSDPLVGEFLFELGFCNKSAVLLSSKEKIDIFQGAHKLNLKILYPFEPANSSRDSNICLKLDYDKIQILFISELTHKQQKQLIATIGEELSADILYHSTGLSKDFMDAVNAKWKFSLGDSKTLTTDGNEIKLFRLMENKNE